MAIKQRPSLSSSLILRCPSCGKGGVFASLTKMKIVKYCRICNLRIDEHDSGDGPAYCTMSLVAIIVISLGAYLEINYKMELWIIIAILTIITIFLSLILLLVFRSVFIALDYKLNIK